MIEDLQVDQYFTLAYAEVNMVTGAFARTQAGHPHPLVLRRDGRDVAEQIAAFIDADHARMAVAAE